MRKVPKQARSQARVDALLDAAALTFHEIGFEAATTNEIAARADVPIGSLYQFFNDKQGIIEALTERYLDEYMLHNAEMIDSPAAHALPVSGMLERLIGGMVQFKESHPGFSVVFSTAHMTERTAEASAAFHNALVRQVDGMMAARFPDFPEEARIRTSTVSIAIFKALIEVTEPPYGLSLEEMMRETRAALRGYMRAALVANGCRLPEDLA